jgi:hypothetical protein
MPSNLPAPEELSSPEGNARFELREPCLAREPNRSKSEGAFS